MAVIFIDSCVPAHPPAAYAAPRHAARKRRGHVKRDMRYPSRSIQVLYLTVITDTYPPQCGAKFRRDSKFRPQAACKVPATSWNQTDQKHSQSCLETNSSRYSSRLCSFCGPNKLEPSTSPQGHSLMGAAIVEFYAVASRPCAPIFRSLTAAFEAAEHTAVVSVEPSMHQVSCNREVVRCLVRENMRRKAQVTRTFAVGMQCRQCTA
jgi:hypothetical protein